MTTPTPKRERAIRELVEAAKEVAAWPFKRPRPFVARISRAVKDYETATEHEEEGGADHDDPEDEDDTDPRVT